MTAKKRKATSKRRATPKAKAKAKPKAKPKPKAKSIPARKVKRTERAPMRDDGIARRQSALLRLSSAIAAATNEQEICESVVNGLRDDALGYAFLGVFLIDTPTGDRVMVASVGWTAAQPGFRLA